MVPHKFERFEITDGPSKMDLMLALFDGGPGDRREVLFTLECDIGHLSETILHPPCHAKLIINRMSRKDGYVERWFFRGRLNGLEGEIGRKNSGVLSDVDVSCRASGYFSTEIRKGWVDIESPPQWLRPQKKQPQSQA